jgi:FixJ family two-component response regulator
MGKRIVHWSSVDWSKRDIEISREIGVSRERVRQMRPQETRAVRSYALTVERATPRITPAVDWNVQDWRQTNKEIAASIGCAIARVEVERKKIGAPKSESKFGSNSHIDSERKRLIENAILNGEMSIKQISEDFGTSVSTVYLYAKRLNGPRWESRRNNQ